MKTVMKKLLSIMLVAILLVSALPFQAMAADAKAVNVVAYYGDMDYSETVQVSTETTCALALISTIDPEWAEYYTFVRYDAGSGVSTVGNEQFTVTDGMTVYIRLAEKTESEGSGSSDSGVTVIPPAGEEDKDEDTTTGSSSTNNGSTNNGSTDNGSSNNGTTKPEGEPQPNPSVIECALTVDYRIDGYEVRTHNTTVGTLYKQFVGVPARGGYDFQGWYSEAKEGFIDVDKDAIMGTDTITAIWSAAKKFNLTLDENRDDIETVNRVKQVTYGEPIGTLPTPSDRKGYVFMGWKLNGTMITAATEYELQGDATAYAVWKLESDTEGEAMNGTHTQDGKVYLEIYTNGDTATLAKRVDITSYAADNKITRSEVEAVAKKYVSVKAGYTLKYEGLFDEESWWWYTRDPETDGVESVVVNRDGDDYVYVMVKNVKTVAADPTNPKTGDSIFMAFTVMTASASALALAYFFSKKRAF